MRGRLTASPAVFAFVFCVLPVFAPQQVFGQAAGSIAGQVRIYPGNVVSSSVMVTIMGRGTIVTTTFTDNEGRFGVNGLPPGEYHVLINDDAYQPVDAGVRIDSVTSSTMAIVNVYLVPRDAEKPGRPGPEMGGNTRLTDPAQYTRRVPKPARKEFEKAVNSEKEGKTDAAIRHYQKAIDLAPDFYAARNNLGSALLGKAQFGEAREQFERVLQLNPSDAQGYFNLANLGLLTQRYDEAELWVQRGLSRQPDSAFGQFLQGSLYARSGRSKDAENALRRCLELDPVMAKAHLALANLYLQQRRNDAAAAELRAFLESFPNDTFAPKAKEVLKKLEGKADAADLAH